MKTDDQTELMRRIMVASENTKSDATIAAESDRTWTTQQLGEEFEVRGFLAPFVTVVRKSDGVRGTMKFRHDPRVYYAFEADK